MPKKMVCVTSLVVMLLIAAIGFSCSGGEYTPGPSPALSETPAPSPTATLPQLTGAEATPLRVSFPLAAGPLEGTPQFELATALPVVPSTVKAYRVTGPIPTIESVTEIGKRLGLTGQANKVDNDIVMSEKSGDRTKMLTVDLASGSIELVVFDAKGGSILYSEPLSLTEDQKPEQIATDFLTSAGLLPAEAQLVGAQEGGSWSNIKGQTYTYPVVAYTRYIDSFPITGLGAKFWVRIAGKGEVGEVYRVWPNVEPYAEVSIISPQEAYDRFTSGKGDYVPSLYLTRVTVKEMFLAYWTGSQSLKYVCPVYAFKGTMVYAGGLTEDGYIGWVNAIP